VYIKQQVLLKNNNTILGRRNSLHHGAEYFIRKSNFQHISWLKLIVLKSLEQEHCVNKMHQNKRL
jgi:hypothetical protein